MSVKEVGSLMPRVRQSRQVHHVAILEANAGLATKKLLHPWQCRQPLSAHHVTGVDRVYGIPGLALALAGIRIFLNLPVRLVTCRTFRFNTAVEQTIGVSQTQALPKPCLDAL